MALFQKLESAIRDVGIIPTNPPAEDGALTDPVK